MEYSDVVEPIHAHSSHSELTSEDALNLDDEYILQPDL